MSRRTLLTLAFCLTSFPLIAATGVRSEPIFDPNLKMNAYSVTIPADWKFEGTYVAGTSCTQVPFPVFRAYSPDGLTELRRLPRLDWSWTNSKLGAGVKHPDCLDLDRSLSGQDFIKYLMGLMQVAYVRDAPLPQRAIDAQQKQLAEANARNAANSKMLGNDPMVQRGELAGAYGEYRNGSFTIEEHVMARLMCIHTPLASFNQKGMFIDTCNATVRIVRAPKGQLAGVLAQFETQRYGAAETPEWMTKYMQVQIAKSEQMARQRQVDFNRAQAVRAQQHQQFLATMRAGTDRSMANARAIANSNHTITSDWCDYALDRQTVSGTAGAVKVSSAYTHTWSDGAGHYYQTNNPSANPNGVLGGNWTQQQKVHGDGTPY